MAAMAPLNSNPWIPGHGLLGMIVAVGNDVLLHLIRAWSWATPFLA